MTKMISSALPGLDRLRRHTGDRTIVGGLFGIAIAIGAYHGFDRPIYQENDTNIVYIYQTLLINDGLMQEYLDHTGYVYFLILSGWLKLLHMLSIVPFITISDLEGAAHMRESFQALLQASRWLSVLLSATLASVLYVLLRMLVSVRWVAVLVALMIIISFGMVDQAIRLHTELPATLSIFLALLMLMASTRSRGPRAYLQLAAAGFFCVAAMLTKYQAFPLLMALPLVPFMWLEKKRPLELPTGILGRWSGVSMIGLWALVFSIPAFVMVITPMVLVTDQARLLPALIYLPLIIAYVALICLLYAMAAGKTGQQTVLGLAAIGCGMALGIYLVFIHHDPRILYTTANFINQLSDFASNTPAGQSFKAATPDTAMTMIMAKLMALIEPTLIRAFQPGGTGNAMWPIYWAVGLGALVTAPFHWRLSLKLAFFLGLALAMEAFSRFRYLAPWYLIFIEPWVWIAFALLLDAVLVNRTRIARRLSIAAPMVVAAPLILVLAGVGW
ncbi:MAG TPA: hypothetical protein ENI69_03915, partial [Rhodospirillales bacterium]|nr:hypothetical protein [Rhodospirillales bacterium]